MTEEVLELRKAKLEMIKRILSFGLDLLCMFLILKSGSNEYLTIALLILLIRNVK